MGFEGFKIDDQVVPSEQALAPLIAKARSFTEKQQILSAQYFVTGVGCKRIGIRSALCSRSTNILKSDAMVVARKS
jgi:hypothetical protein